jgi:hypothetical protein
MARAALYAARLAVGFAVYLLSGRTPRYAYYGMVGLFCLTRGRSNDLLSRFIGLASPPYRLSGARGVLGDMAVPEVREPVVSELRNRGYYVFPRAIPADLCDRLLDFAQTRPCIPRQQDGATAGSALGKIVFPRSAPKAVRYDFDPQDLLQNEDVQRLLADWSLVALAQAYLGARPAVDVLNLWWNTDYSRIPDSEAAQYFHFDMDRPKWLKFFFYLTDVGPENGPHSFVAGSHRTGAIPAPLLRKGYSRLSDEEVWQAFGQPDIHEFVAPRGTIIAEDTRGLHKGKLVQSGDRLVLQIQFSNSLFGASHGKASIGQGALCPDFKDRLERFPELYAAYLG